MKFIAKWKTLSFVHHHFYFSFFIFYFRLVRVRVIDMVERTGYRTKQRDVILQYLKSHSEEPLTAENVARALSGQAGQTTVYRALERLVREHVLLKFEIPGENRAFFQYPGEETGRRGRLYCTLCGKVDVVDCDFLSGLAGHIESEHNFTLNRSSAVLFGQCGGCRRASPASGELKVES